MSEINQTTVYGTLLTELKSRIHSAQYAALRAVNKELIALYWDIGQLIEERQAAEGWGKAVVERLSADLRTEFGEKSGFSGRNLWYMRTFYLEYKDHPKLQPMAAEIAWTKNTLILDRCASPLQYCVAYRLSLSGDAVGINGNYIYPLIGIPLTTICAFILSALTASLLAYIPITRRLVA